MIEDRVSTFLRSLAIPRWTENALCAQIDPDAFFPDSGSVEEAKSVCEDCPVRTQCLQHAIEHDERFGVWGGTSRRERSRMNAA